MDFATFLVFFFAFFLCSGTVIAVMSKLLSPLIVVKVLQVCKIQCTTDNGAVDCALFIGWSSFFIGFVGLYAVAVSIR